jgi:hypothetical protein
MIEDEGKLIMYGQLEKPPLITIVAKKKIVQRRLESMTERELEELEKILNEQLENFINDLKEKI